MRDLTFRYRAEESLIFDEDCHYYLDIPVLCDLDYYLNRKVLFLLDTGAYITVISKATAMRLEFEKLPFLVESFPLTGIAGSCDASLKEIPGMVVGGRLLKGVKVAIPHEDTKYNILGMNVLDHFSFLVDAENNKIYFNDNSRYKMPDELKSAAVLTISDME
jgi:predicted aspartyl protease